MAEAGDPLIPQELHYTEQHEWLYLESDVGTIGTNPCLSGDFCLDFPRLLGRLQGHSHDVTDLAWAPDDTKLATCSLDNCVMVWDVAALQLIATLEAVKAVEELYSPITGEVVEINESLEGHPDQINGDPYTGGWMIKVRLENRAELEQLITADKYDDYLKGA